ncbi:MAG: hypothetical protein AABY46_06795 [Nitrospirota bacterium]
MPNPKIDTSPANVATVLRHFTDFADAVKRETEGKESPITPHVRALADALDTQAAVTWGEREQKARDACFAALCQARQTGLNPRDLTIIDIALRAAFPELVPSDD